MSVLTPERVDTTVGRWLEFDTDDGPAGPLFLGGRYAEFEITMTGGGVAESVSATGCGWCTGSNCTGRPVICWA